jgi:uncharacterized protein YdaU (DUF1376 family)
MKPPAFQFYARDWLSSTLGMPWEVAGVYIHLLAWSWDNGPLPKSSIWRRRVIGPDAVRLWHVVKKRWKKTKDGWINERLEHQRSGQNAFALRGEKGAKVRWQASSKHMPKRWPASASASSKDLKPAAARPVPFRVYAAIAARVLTAAEGLDCDPGTLAEQVKIACAKQTLPYNSTIVQKALEAAQVARARRHA